MMLNSRRRYMKHRDGGSLIIWKADPVKQFLEYHPRILQVAYSEAPASHANKQICFIGIPQQIAAAVVAESIDLPKTKGRDRDDENRDKDCSFQLFRILSSIARVWRVAQPFDFSHYQHCGCPVLCELCKRAGTYEPIGNGVCAGGIKTRVGKRRNPPLQRTQGWDTLS